MDTANGLNIASRIKIECLSRFSLRKAHSDKGTIRENRYTHFSTCQVKRITDDDKSRICPFLYELYECLCWTRLLPKQEGKGECKQQQAAWLSLKLHSHKSNNYSESAFKQRELGSAAQSCCKFLTLREVQEEKRTQVSEAKKGGTDLDKHHTDLRIM